MRFSLRAIVGLLSILLAHGFTRAQAPFFVSQTQSGTGSFSVTFPGSDALGWSINLTVNLTGTGVSSGGLQVLIQANQPGVVVREVFVTVNYTTSVDVNRRWTSVSLTPYNPSSSIALLEHFEQVGGLGDLRIAGVTVSGNIGDPNSSFPDLIAGDFIGNIVADGTIYSDVLLTQASNQGTSATITKVQSNLASVVGSVRAPYGEIVQVIADNGDIGRSGGGSNSAQIQTQRSIRELRARHIYADVNTTLNGGTGEIQRLQTTVGDFVGTLTTTNLNRYISGQPDGIAIAGNLDANLFFSGQVYQPITITGSLPATRSVTINGSLNVNAPLTFTSGTLDGTLSIGQSLVGAVTLPVKGLHGQVIVNSMNSSGQWLGTVKVGPDGDPNQIILRPPPNGDAPYYSVTSAQLGGGAVGLAPFNLNGNDCVPVTGATVSLSTGNCTPATLRLYGPIFSVGSLPPIVVESRPSGGGSWVQHTSDFVIKVNPNSQLREISVKQGAIPTIGFVAGRDYMIFPVMTDMPDFTVLRFLLVDGTPPVRWPV